jgi:hypothetical protein
MARGRPRERLVAAAVASVIAGAVSLAAATVPAGARAGDACAGGTQRHRDLDLRLPATAGLPPGATASVDLSLAAPLPPGPYRFEAVVVGEPALGGARAADAGGAGAERLAFVLLDVTGAEVGRAGHVPLRPAAADPAALVGRGDAEAGAQVASVRLARGEDADGREALHVICVGFEALDGGPGPTSTAAGGEPAPPTAAAVHEEGAADGNGDEAGPGGAGGPEEAPISDGAPTTDGGPTTTSSAGVTTSSAGVTTSSAGVTTTSAAGPPGSMPRPRPLPVTGGSSASLTALGLAFLALGTGLVVRARRAS